MSGLWLLSYVLLWMLVVGLAVVCLSLMRLVGALHQRLGPAPAAILNDGPEIGQNAGSLLSATWPRQESPGMDVRASFWLFLSADCPACEELLPSLFPFAQRVRAKADVRVILVNESDADVESLAEVFNRHKLPYLVDRRIAQGLRVTSTPYGIWTDAKGIVSAKGVVNHSEHLESLELAADRGVGAYGQEAALGRGERLGSANAKDVYDFSSAR
jgi:methylamine dehydrogenase accessory protein MauD